MIVYADGYIWETLWGPTKNGSALCGSGGAGEDAWTEEIFNIEFKFPHE